MATGRPAALVATCDQWVRSSHAGTAVDAIAIGHGLAELTLGWEPPIHGPAPGGRRCPAPGVAVDRLCRVYRLRAATLERRRVGPTASGLDYASLPDAEILIGPGETAPTPGADFAAARPVPLLHATGIAIDDADRLFLADRDRRTVTVSDLWSRRLLRSISVATPSHPTRTPHGLAADGSTVFVAVQSPPGLLHVSATTDPSEIPLPTLSAGLRPIRVTVLGDGTPVVLAADGHGAGVLLAGSRDPLAVGAASDITLDAEGAVVVAPCPPPVSARSTILIRFAPTAQGWLPEPPLDATGYDGGGIARTRDGRILFTTADGLRLAVVERVRYAAEGTCVTFRLDSGAPRNRWGRLLLEACVPDGTGVSIGTVTADDDYATSRTPSPALPADCTPVEGVAAPPLPPLSLDVDHADGGVHRRGGATTPWWTHPGRFQSFEAPVVSAPGRFLWVTLRLSGDTRRTPRIRDLRVEHRVHTLTERLPRVFSDDPDRADFLSRFLAPLDGILHDLDLRSRCRDILVDPRATPTEALDWLASFFGLVLDQRWAEAARRRLVEEIVSLYRRRGTVGALTRYLEIFLAGDRATDPSHEHWISPVIVEHFRLRGVSGSFGGDETTAASRSVLGHGFRVGGAIGDPHHIGTDPVATGAGDPVVEDAAWYAHRFSVLVPRSLGAEEESAVRWILDTERPVHTAYELCTVDAGMRVGHGVHVGLSSIVGPTGQFEAAVLDRSLLGRRAVLGGRSTGLTIDASRVGTTARVG